MEIEIEEFWKPIDEAPKDGTKVIAGKPSALAGMFYVPYPLTSRYLNGRWTAECGKDNWQPYDPQPTHWMPSPPQENEE